MPRLYPHSLRLKLVGAVLITYLAIAAVFSAVLLPFGDQIVESGQHKTELLLAVAAQSQAERLANDISGKRLDAVERRLGDMVRAAGLERAAAYGRDGRFLRGAGRRFTPPVLDPAHTARAADGDLIWQERRDGDASLLHLSRITGKEEPAGYLLLATSLADVEQAKAASSAIFLGLLGGIFLLLALLFSLILERTVIRPVTGLESAMAAFARGKTQARVPPAGQDELGRLGASFNAMAERIQESQASLRQAEENYRSIFENAVEGIFQAAADGRLINANPSLARTMGYSSPGAFLAGSPDLFAMIPVLQADPERLLDALTADGAVADFEMQITRRDRSTFWARISLRMVPDPEGLPLRYEGSVMDVTARKEKERAEEARRAAEQASKEKSAFLARMSHEIRTPMNALLGMCQLLGDTELNPGQQRLLNTIGSSGELLMALLGDILDLSRIEAGRVDLETISFDPRTLAEEVCALFAQSARDKGLDLNCRVDAGLPPALRGDPTRIKQVLLNLVGNAVKFTESGEVSLRLAAAPEPDSVRFTVRDTGPGIPTDKQEAVFESFAQADTSTTRRYGGAGLGLAICKGLVERMGGRIELDSGPGRGCAFSFTLPLPAAAPAPPPAAPCAPDRTDSRGLRVLVADDSALNREIARQFLQGVADLVDEARDGLEAVGMTARGGYHLVLMDVEMPGLDGLAAARRIRTLPGLPSRTPIVGLTARAGIEDRQRILDAGMEDVLTKPVRREELAALAARFAPGADRSAGQVDWAYVLDLVGGDPADLDAFCRTARDLLPGEARDLEKAARSGDLESFTCRAHALKSTAASFGAAELADLARRAEQAGRTRDAARIRELLPRLKELLAGLLAEVRARVSQDKPPA
ncbi:MAG: ATP-binding protein [Thermodesulfobacteriota bacterium]